jgi:GR25 family glycosyltransferase involved in LPS biosynthesis
MENINTFFDKIYVINLSYAIDKKNSIIEQFNKYGITNYEFFVATDKNELDIDKMKFEKKWAYPGNDFYCTQECTCRGGGHHLEPGQIALSISCYRLYRHIVENNYKKCLILEDDCILTDEILNFESLSKSIPEDWELLYLGNAEHTWPGHGDIGNDFFRRCFGVPCTHIYAVTNECALKLSEEIFPIRANIDGFLHRFIIDKGIIKNAYISINNLGQNGSIMGVFGSDASS